MDKFPIDVLVEQHDTYKAILYINNFDVFYLFFIHFPLSTFSDKIKYLNMMIQIFVVNVIIFDIIELLVSTQYLASRF